MSVAVRCCPLLSVDPLIRCIRCIRCRPLHPLHPLHPLLSVAVRCCPLLPAIQAWLTRKVSPNLIPPHHERHSSQCPSMQMPSLQAHHEPFYANAFIASTSWFKQCTNSNLCSCVDQSVDQWFDCLWWSISHQGNAPRPSNLI